MRRRVFLPGAGGLASLSLISPAHARGKALRVGVVGAGIVGAAIAAQLAEAGAAVTVFEKDAPASGTTGKSFAWINAVVLDPHYRAVRLKSLQAWRELDPRLQLGVTWGGYLNWANDPAEIIEARSYVEPWDGTPYAFRKLGTLDELLALSPNSAREPFGYAAFSKIDGHVDPVWVTHRFLDHARASGADVRHPCELLEIELRRGRLVAVRTTRGRFALDRLVIAAGNDAPRLTAKLGYSLPLRHAPGLLAHSVPMNELSKLVYNGPGLLEFKQMANGRIVGGDAARPPASAQHAEIIERVIDMPEPLPAEHGQRMLASIARAIPAVRHAMLDRVTLGFRVMPRDGNPVVGALPGVPDVHVAAMHSGVTLAPIMARYVAQEVLGGPPAEDLAPYRPARFAPRAS